MSFALGACMQFYARTLGSLTLAQLALAACAFSHESRDVVASTDAGYDSGRPSGFDAGPSCPAPPFGYPTALTPRLDAGEYAATIAAVDARGITFAVIGGSEHRLNWPSADTLRYVSVGATTQIYISSLPQFERLRLTAGTGMWDLLFYSDSAFVRSSDDPVVIPDTDIEVTLAEHCSFPTSCNGHAATGTVYDAVVQHGGESTVVAAGSSIPNDCLYGEIHFAGAAQFPGCHETTPDGFSTITEAAFFSSFTYGCFHYFDD
jgi:hypothetical protein